MEESAAKKAAPAGKPKTRRKSAAKKKVKKGPGRGGKREGAGRKAGVKVGPYKGKTDMLTAMDTFRVSEDTHRRIKELRELTKHDEKPFNRMFELWVEQLSKDYGLEE